MSESMPNHPCPFCEKRGLAILPVRPAVARTDTKGAHALPVPQNFLRSAPGCTSTGLDSISLPTASGKYTTRLLRQGYLYVFNEIRGEWKGYIVTELGFLYEFITAQADGKIVSGNYVPPEINKVEFHCFRTGEEYIARCITIPDAARAGKVWLGFSDVAWTPEVLEKHHTSDYRRQHMQVVDVKAWIHGDTNQAGTETFEKLTDVVNEFTHRGKSHEMPAPEPTGRYDPKAGELVMNLAEVQIFYDPAFSYSPFHFSGFQEEAKGMLAFAGQQLQQNQPPMLVCVPDAAGIAMELNQLILELGLEFNNDVKRRWPQATLANISMLRQAMENNAIKQEVSDRQFREDIAFAAKANYAPPNAWDNYQKKRHGARELNEEELDSIGVDAWKKYKKMLNLEKLNRYKKKYKFEHESFNKNIINPLDNAYVSWLKHSHFTSHLVCNFDTHDVASGIAYQTLVCACIREASGRAGPIAHLQTELSKSSDKQEHIFVRAFLFNQDKIQKKLAEAIKHKPKNEDAPWVSMANDVYHSGLREIIGPENKNQLSGAMSGLANYLHQLSSPIMNRLAKAGAKGTSLLAASLPERRLLTLMQTVLDIKDPGKVLVDLRGYQSRKQAARALAGAIAVLAGQDEQRWRSSARAIIKYRGADEKIPWHGLFVVDEESLASAKTLRRKARVNAALVGSNETEFSSLLKGNAEFVVNRSVAAGGIGLILSGLTLGLSFSEFREPGASVTKAWINLGGAITGMLGDIGEISGQILAKTAWGTRSISASIAEFGESWATRAGMIGGAGKFLGVVGGVLAAVWQILGGVEAYRRGDVAFGVISIIIGFAGGLIAVGIAAGVISFGLGFLLAIALAIVGYLINCFKHDEVQHWLDSCFFGAHKLGDEEYSTLDEQNAAFGAFLKGV